MSKIYNVIEKSFVQYSGAVLQSRALVDVRDGLKPSARQIFYSMLLHKLTSSNPYKKTANAVGMAMADFYIHGDSSCEGVIMRAGQPFAMRYPLIDVKGNAGTLIESENWAAMRYTESRLSKISNLLFSDIDKETIEEWRDSYDNSKQFPAVLPSKGFYNIVNGTSGIGVGMASKVPQYNINDVNNALIYLIDHPDCSFEEIYCAPDFATGAILYNEDEVKESMKNGTGFACKLRSVISFDQKEKCFVVTEIPYGVYTNTICSKLEDIINEKDGLVNPGIDRFNDLTGKTPLIKIYLTKSAVPEKVLKYLYKNTSLQHHFGINFTMLENGRFPRVFTWKEMLQAHIDHERIVYRRGFEFDLRKIDTRIHIIDGLLICLASIDEVVQTIKNSQSTAAASVALQSKFLLDEEQAKAVLDMKLSRLAHLEVKKLEDERAKLLVESERIHKILDNEELFKEELKNGWRAVMKQFGDERRTKIINLSGGDEPIEQKQLSVNVTNQGKIFTTETSTLYTQKRNGTGTKFKLGKGEYVVDNFVGNNTDSILFFSSRGNYYHARLNDFKVDEEQYISTILSVPDYDHIVASTVLSKDNPKKYLIFITKKGILKKSEISEYNLRRGGGAAAIKLDADDEIVSVLFTNEERIGILTESGNFLMTETKDVRPIGRTARGVIGMKLNDNDTVIAAHVIPSNAPTIISISGNGLIKQTSIEEFGVQSKNTKGSKIQKLNNNDWMADFIATNDSEILVVSTSSCLKIKTIEIPVLGKSTLGVKSIKMPITDNITKISKL